MNARVEVKLVEGPLGPPAGESPRGAGAVVQFDGVVRLLEEDRELEALLYEAYEPMTSRELRRLAERFADEYPLMAIRVEHSTGRVAVDEVSFRLTIASARRAPVQAAAAAFIDEMKRHVPLWKVAEFADG